jgi:hypothetical protein
VPDWRSIKDRLGMEPDADIARDLGVSREAVRMKRKKFHIPAFRPSRVITDECRNDLGLLRDEEVAQKHGVPITWVKQTRRKSAISLPRNEPGLRDVLANLDWENDTRTDREIADEYGSCVPTICRIRNDLGIPNSRKRGRPGPKSILPEEAGELTPYLCIFVFLSNKEIARRSGLSFRDVGVFRKEHKIRRAAKSDSGGSKWPEIIVRMGKQPDRELADEYGVYPHLISQMRTRLQIPLLGEEVPLVDRILTSDLADAECAQQMNVTLSLVRLVRKYGALDAQD